MAQRRPSNRGIQRLQVAKLTKGMTRINQATPSAIGEATQQIGKTSSLISKKDGWQLLIPRASWTWTHHPVPKGLAPKAHQTVKRPVTQKHRRNPKIWNQSSHHHGFEDEVEGGSYCHWGKNCQQSRKQHSWIERTEATKWNTQRTWETHRQTRQWEQDTQTNRTSWWYGPCGEGPGRIVICSFRDVDGEKAEKLVHEVVLGVRGYQGASATNAAPLVVMAQFDSPAMAFESDPQPKLQSKDARTQIVGIRKLFPEWTSTLQACEPIEVWIRCPNTPWKHTMGMFNSAWAIEPTH